METFPAFFPLKGRRVVIAGDGEGADAKVRLFDGSPAEVVRLVGEGALASDGYAGADLVFVASYDQTFIVGAAEAARAAGAPLNVVDHPELSDFHTPAIVDRGQVVAAIGTAGAAPLLASLLRAEVETRVPETVGTLAALFGSRRDAIRAAFPDLPARRAFLRAMLAGPLSTGAAISDPDAAARAFDVAIGEGWTAVGVVSFLDVPAEPDLISVRAVRALNIADMVAFGPEASGLIATHARRDAEHWSLQRATGEALAAGASAGRVLAVVGSASSQELADQLAGQGVAVTRLAAAPRA
jgi:precorrin-2 dehydrogenase/sirohydrochlorin ferrochelatase